MSAKVYKIRDPKTGLFKGIGRNDWSKKGKIWAGSGPLKSHLRTSTQYRWGGPIDPNWEVLEYEAEPTRVVNITDFLSNDRK